MAILLLGFIAVIAAFVYRSYRDADTPDTRYTLESVGLPAGAALVSTSTAEGLITLTYTLSGKTEIRIVDGQSGEVVGQFEIVSE